MPSPIKPMNARPLYRRWRLRPLPILLLMAAAGPLLNAADVERVQFKPLTAFGAPVEAHVVAMADRLRKRNVMVHCQGLACTDLPEGAYYFTLELTSNQRRVDGVAVLYRSHPVVVVDVGAPEADLDEDAFPTVTGQVTGGDPAKLWVKLQPLYSETAVAAAVDAQGRFRVEQVRPGRLLLLVFEDGRLIRIEPYTCEGPAPAPIVVKLGVRLRAQPAAK